MSPQAELPAAAPAPDALDELEELELEVERVEHRPPLHVPFTHGVLQLPQCCRFVLVSVSQPSYPFPLQSAHAPKQLSEQLLPTQEAVPLIPSQS